LTPEQLEALDYATGCAQDLVDALQLLPIVEHPELAKELILAGAQLDRLKREYKLQLHAFKADADGEQRTND